MPDLLKQRDFWEPLKKFQDPKAYEDFDMAVKAYIQIDITNHLMKNMALYVKEGNDYQKLIDFVHRWNLSAVVLKEHAVHKLGFSMKTLESLYHLEKELWSNLDQSQHSWAIEQLCRNYRNDLEALILRHLSRNEHKTIPNILTRSARFTQLLSKTKSYRLRIKTSEQSKNALGDSLMSRVKKFFLGFSALP